MMETIALRLQVAKDIVPLLSKSTYQKSFSNAIRELVSNAYDADSLSVNITISEDLKTITIEDNGNGMSIEEFEEYICIAGKKNKNKFTRRYKRKRIGQFGIGFLSIFPFCEKLEITTTAENSDEIVNATIPVSEYFKTDFTKNVSEIPVSGRIFSDSSQRGKHYTKIELHKPTYFVKQYFTKKESKKKDTILSWEPFERFLWELKEDLPISFHPKSKYNQVMKYEETIGIEVFVNKEQIFRNEPCANILKQSEIVLNEVKCSYVLATDYKSIKPFEARGIKLRVNNVAIGARTDFNLKRSRGFPHLHWINGEIAISSEIKDHLNLSRDGFISSELVDDIYEKLSDILREVAKNIDIIAEAEKELHDIDNKRALVRPKNEIIRGNIDKLVKKGFEVKYSKTITDSDSFIVNKNDKIVTILKTIDNEKEKINLLRKKYEIIYEKNKDISVPCKFVKNNVISINRDYPLYRSKTYGNLFKKLHLLLLVAESQSNTTKEMLDLILSNIIDEFEDYK